MPTSVTYSATLDVRRETVQFLSALLHAERRRRGTRRGRRALGCFAQAVLILRWFCDGTRIRQLAADHRIGRTTAYRYLHEGIDALAVHAPDLHQALNAAQQAGLTHLNLDGIVIATDRVAAPGPNGADLWWSGKHKHHGGNIQVLSAPDGRPLWVSDVRPGREHDITCARRHGAVTALAAVRDHLPALADLGYEGAADTIHVPIKKKAGQRKLSDDQHTYNKLLRGLRGVGERANALLTVTFKALRRVSLDPWRIGRITQAALVLLYRDNDWTPSASHNVIFGY
ncbi:IS5/IS1182 family transposase [Spongiactinospora rosea]|uniref:IS5/IS1182 family transposase n=1 Tax=Spongiactinospora rosea TaxID=2248750 RepID=A0A366LE66_9ACTN|nr:transposase family protein [Spongiactinospora rosea]RBQ12157.1 IS5/IS1182 family transposase [Spongiactinospora rosea]